MDENIINDLVKAKVSESYLTTLIDTILDNSRYNKYNRYGLTINDDAPIYALVKAIDPEAFNNRREAAKTCKDEED